ncbi:hypothetical protein SDJN02_19317, partial [Cucurbita argyrosperma subsp. argyrosperma]
MIRLLTNSTLQLPVAVAFVIFLGDSSRSLCCEIDSSNKGFQILFKIIRIRALSFYSASSPSS